MEQLKTGNTPINALMLHTGRAYRHFEIRRTFWVKEYNLEMNITTIDDNMPLFQVGFNELEPGAVSDAEHTLSPKEFINEVFLRENFLVKDKQIVFELEAFCVTHNDYLFSFNDFGMPRDLDFVISWSYDLETGKFIHTSASVTDSVRGILSFVEVLKAVVKNPKWSYIEAMIYNSVTDVLKYEMTAAGVSDTRKKNILSAFNTQQPTPSLSANESHTFFVDFILALHRMEA